MSPPRKLYKYVPPERIDILTGGLIRFTQPSSLNDPFEMQPVFETLFPEEAMNEILAPPFEYIEESLRKKYQELSSEQKSAMSEDQLISLVKNNPDILKMVLKDVEPLMRQFVKTFAPEAKKLISGVFDKNVGMLSLTETPENILMWSHYAAAHKGFAIEFDATDEYFNRRRSEKDEFYHLRKVNYIDRDSSGRTLYDLNGDDVMVTKMKVWEYECEWRMLMPLKDAEKVFEIDSESIYLFTIPARAITSLILGMKSSVQLKSTIEQSLNILKRDIPVRLAYLDPSTGAISIK